MSLFQQAVNLDFVAIDIETTGLDPKFDEIIEIGLWRIIDGQVDSYKTFLKVDKVIPLRIKNLTGIDNGDLRDAPVLKDIGKEILDFIGPLPIVGHNIDFDLSFLGAKLDHYFNNLTFDTYELSQLVYPLLGTYQLSKLSNRIGLEVEKSHRALEDAFTCAKLFFNILKGLLSLEPEFLVHINQFIGSKSWRHKALFLLVEKESLRHFPQTKIKGTSPFLKEIEYQGQNLFKASLKSEPNKSYLDMQLLEKVISTEGPLARQFPNYEDRSQQREMLRLVGEAFNKENHLIVEAGTGTGKSLAYLVPALYWALQNKEAVVVATHTINLQEQLWSKDIPLLRSMLDLDFRVALVKGRANYICLRKWSQLVQEGQNISEERLRFAIRMFFWLKETKSGDRSELNLAINQNEFWNEISGDADSCLGARCSWHRNYCFLMRARREATEADLLIVNHSLLLSDIKTENAILPPFQQLVLDEAHHLEDGATEHLGLEFSFRSFFGYLNTLHNVGTNGNFGLLKNIKMRSSKYEEALSEEEKQQFNGCLNEAQEHVFKLKEYGQLLFAMLNHLAVKGQKGSDNSYSLRIKPEERSSSDWLAILTIFDNLRLRLSSLVHNFDKLGRILELQSEVFNAEAKDFANHFKLCLSYKDALEAFFGNHQENNVYWIEIQGRLDWTNCTLKIAPIKVNQLLYEKLFAAKKTVIVTSATLTVDDSFEHFLDRTGLNLFPEASICQKQLLSPFNYEQQALICVPKDIPSPLEVSEESFSEIIAPFITKIAEFYEGKTLVLFTSHRMLKDTYRLIKEFLEDKGICVLGHNIDGNRTRLTEEFKETEKSVLLGASSFWEGVDIPGANLQCVIIVKLPFWSPSIPTVEARLEDLELSTNNSFYGFSIPQAIIRFKQGFGRLIRSCKDEGSIIILDKRIIQKSYGQKFFNSLPLKNHFRGDMEAILRKIGQWKEGNRPKFSNLINNASNLHKVLAKKKDILDTKENKNKLG